ncbi:hypothetical protein [Streptomyces sp. YS415]|uniref:hypothetical protein n=1 Tax=Streptomyces sp. YS415 TaxID=2944806 RepID=UPI0020216E5C|nr:hypothetical protein [Streptomyces sp. YS415]MCL7424530.1 hypothetical protein [Streptomyces sp. YS415]
MVNVCPAGRRASAGARAARRAVAVSAGAVRRYGRLDVLVHFPGVPGTGPRQGAEVRREFCGVDVDDVGTRQLRLAALPRACGRAGRG